MPSVITTHFLKTLEDEGASQYCKNLPEKLPVAHLDNSRTLECHGQRAIDITWKPYHWREPLPWLLG